MSDALAKLLAAARWYRTHQEMPWGEGKCDIEYALFEAASDPALDEAVREIWEANKTIQRLIRDTCRSDGRWLGPIAADMIRENLARILAALPEEPPHE